MLQKIHKVLQARDVKCRKCASFRHYDAKLSSASITRNMATRQARPVSANAMTKNLPSIYLLRDCVSFAVISAALDGLDSLTAYAFPTLPIRSPALPASLPAHSYWTHAHTPNTPPPMLENRKRQIRAVATSPAPHLETPANPRPKEHPRNMKQAPASHEEEGPREW